MEERALIIAFFTIIIIFIGFIIYMDYHEDIVAMEHGYTQKVINNKVIWVKDCNYNKGAKNE